MNTGTRGNLTYTSYIYKYLYRIYIYFEIVTDNEVFIAKKIWRLEGDEGGAE